MIRLSLSSCSKMGVIAVVTVSLATLPFDFAVAQAEDDDSSETIEEVVVIGTAGGAGVDRQSASFAVTTASANDIEQFSPKNTGDLLKLVPGVWSESSGGAGGSNVDVRGLPGGSDTPYLLFTINGSPIFGANKLSFLDQSVLFRVDETIAGIEGLRGGPNAVFGKGEPGLTVNFRLKEGSDETKGRVKYTTSDYDLQRLDAVMSGEIANDFYYMIGGYFSGSPGIRDTQFESEEGQQFTVNLTKYVDSGKVNVFARVTDDHTAWTLPFALSSGNDPGTFAQLGNATRLREITVNSAGNTETFDFANGRGWDGIITGGNLEFDLGNEFTLRDNFTFTSGDANTFGFVPSGSAVTAAALAAVIGEPVETTDGRMLGSGDFVQTYGHWVVLKDVKSAINDLSINKVFDGGHDVTLGYYQATWSSDDRWHLGNGLAVHNTANGFPLANATEDDIANAGGATAGPFGLVDSGDARANAFYIADSWQLTDLWRIDLGVRFEEVTQDFVLDSGPGFADGTIDQVDSIDYDEIAYTAAVNYDFRDNLGFYLRYSDGYRIPDFDDIRGGATATQDVSQLEAGVKFNNDWADVYATAFSTDSTTFLNVVGGVGGPSTNETESLGIELEGHLRFGLIDTQVVATIQDTEIVESNITANIGNSVLRQPDFQVRISPSVLLEGDSFNATVYAALTFVDDRFGDNGNAVLLESYEKYDLGVQVYLDNGLLFQVHGDNLSDSDGITEGNPRDPSAPLGRPIFGRSVRFSVGYEF